MRKEIRAGWGNSVDDEVEMAIFISHPLLSRSLPWEAFSYHSRAMSAECRTVFYESIIEDQRCA